jgi:hypothetical protein
MEYYSDALIDTSAISKTIASVVTGTTWSSAGSRRDLPLLEFLDFCSLVEGIVLHDRLIAIKPIAGKVRCTLLSRQKTTQFKIVPAQVTS